MRLVISSDVMWGSYALENIADCNVASSATMTSMVIYVCATTTTTPPTVHECLSTDFVALLDALTTRGADFGALLSLRAPTAYTAALQRGRISLELKGMR